MARRFDKQSPVNGAPCRHDRILRITVFLTRDRCRARNHSYNKIDVRAGEGCHTLATLLPAACGATRIRACGSESSGTLFKPLFDALAFVPELHFDRPSLLPTTRLEKNNQQSDRPEPTRGTQDGEDVPPVADTVAQPKQTVPDRVLKLGTWMPVLN
ncbi:hypothetical protein BDN71DRAFT_1502508 [Pleurotus eryngii]|uniref:Uncharacterized protein n=1 Tax=Pleurotus eryngii TaxID=5323 RepID=A0A9P6DB45_PLEER|nr:hypothetical protein BDN71DRAFT_1502508 [Pleurotus eryngii]